MIDKAPCTTPMNWNRFSLSLSRITNERDVEEDDFGSSFVSVFSKGDPDTHK